MKTAQSGILAPIPKFGRYVFFDVQKNLAQATIAKALSSVAPQAGVDDWVVGLGLQTVLALKEKVPGLREFSALEVRSESRASSIQIPANSYGLLLWLRGSDAASLLALEEKLKRYLVPAFVYRESVELFKHTIQGDETPRDLTGYEDGTENPEGEAASAAAFVSSQDPVTHGSSLLAIQQWEHDWSAFNAMSVNAQDHAIGRVKASNEEIEDAPESAHVKRTAQEDFEPEAFVVRRSMPWRTEQASGLMFAAFANTLDAFEAQIRRMAGLDDGVVDAIFQFSKPTRTAYFWCPPAIMS